MAHAQRAFGDVEDQRAAGIAEEARMDASDHTGSQAHGRGTVMARLFKRIQLCLSAPETLPAERRHGLPFRPGHSIDVIEEEPATDDSGDTGAGKEGGRRPDSTFGSRLSTGTSSSSEVPRLLIFRPEACSLMFCSTQYTKRQAHRAIYDLRWGFVRTTSPQRACQQGDMMLALLFKHFLNHLELKIAAAVHSYYCMTTACLLRGLLS